MRRIILDTNAYVALLCGDGAVLNALSAADEIGMSAVVLGELHAGFRGGNRRERNEGLLADFLAKPGVRVLGVSAETAEVFGGVKDGLKRAGKPIPVNDIWLAAQALETGSVLATYDKHFREVPGLRLWNV